MEPTLLSLSHAGSFAALFPSRYHAPYSRCIPSLICSLRSVSSASIKVKIDEGSGDFETKWPCFAFDLLKGNSYQKDEIEKNEKKAHNNGTLKEFKRTVKPSYR
jgi:hypothetical protein